jgi:hypothetical protein
MLTPEKIAELKEKHGSKLSAVMAPKGVLVFRKPSRAEYDRWSDKTNANRGEASSAARELAQCCLVTPDRDTFIAILEDAPSLLCGEILSAITSMCGLDETYEIKKL